MVCIFPELDCSCASPTVPTYNRFEVMNSSYISIFMCNKMIVVTKKKTERMAFGDEASAFTSCLFRSLIYPNPSQVPYTVLGVFFSAYLDQRRGSSEVMEFWRKPVMDQVWPCGHRVTYYDIAVTHTNIAATASNIAATTNDIASMH